MSISYLKPNIVAEPLISDWYAWTHLIAPTTASCNIGHHIKLMRSYIQAPLIHKKTLENPSMLGGPFVDLKGIYVEKVKDLLADTIKKYQQTLIDLGKSIKSLDISIQSSAIGNSLEGFYTTVPENLKGLVELVYDLNNHPSIRFIEYFIYKKYYTDAYQSVLLYEITNEDQRSFVMSTPRVNKENCIEIKLPFCNAIYDQLFSARTIPQDVNKLIDQLQIKAKDQDLFSKFFTTSIEYTYTAVTTPSIRVRYYGHACVFLETNKESILVDPVISYQSKCDPSRYTLQDLPDIINYVLLTHNHQDHISIETLLQIRHKVQNIIIPSNTVGALQDPSLKLILKHLGFNNIIVMGEGDSIITENSNKIIGFPFQGEHADLNIQTKLNYYVKLNNKSFFFAVDSNNIENRIYDFIYKEVNSIDYLFLGMECEGAPLSWVYGPLVTKPLQRNFDQNRKLSGSNFEKAWEIVSRLHCKEVYVYAMGQEPWLNYIMALNYTENSIQIVESNKLIKKCTDFNIKSSRLYGKHEWVIPN